MTGAGAAADAGPAQTTAIAGTATTLAGAAASPATGLSGPGRQISSLALAIANRNAVLERETLARGC